MKNKLKTEHNKKKEKAKQTKTKQIKPKQNSNGKPLVIFQIRFIIVCFLIV
jgi:hypothetical protein